VERGNTGFRSERVKIRAFPPFSRSRNWCNYKPLRALHTFPPTETKLPGKGMIPERLKDTSPNILGLWGALDHGFQGTHSLVNRRFLCKHALSRHLDLL